MQCEKRRRIPQSIGTFFVRIRAGLSCGSCFVSRRGNRDGRGRRNPLLQLDDLELRLLLLPADCRGLRLLLLCFARFHEEASCLGKGTGWGRHTLLTARPPAPSQNDSGKVLLFLLCALASGGEDPHTRQCE